MLKELAIKIARHVGIIECNVQFAYDTQSYDYRVIEINASFKEFRTGLQGHRLSPCTVAAKLALGYGPAIELKNSVTRTTSAFLSLLSIM